MARRSSVLLVAFLLLMLVPPAAHAQVPAAKSGPQLRRGSNLVEWDRTGAPSVM